MSVYETLKEGPNDGRLFDIPDTLREMIVLYSIHVKSGDGRAPTVEDLNSHINSENMADVMGLNENQTINNFGNTLINKHVYKLVKDNVVEKKVEERDGLNVNTYTPVKTDAENVQRLEGEIRKMWEAKEEASLKRMRMPVDP